MQISQLTRRLKLPTFEVAGMTLIKRMAWVIDDGVITKCSIRCSRRTGTPTTSSPGFKAVPR